MHLPVPWHVGKDVKIACIRVMPIFTHLATSLAKQRERTIKETYSMNEECVLRTHAEREYGPPLVHRWTYMEVFRVQGVNRKVQHGSQQGGKDNQIEKKNRHNMNDKMHLGIGICRTTLITKDYFTETG